MGPSPSEASAGDAAQRPTAREKGILPDSRAPLTFGRKERRRQANPDHKDHLREILEQAKHLDFRSRGAEIENFEKSNRLELTRKSENTENILHVLAARSNWSSWDWWPDEKIEQFLNWLLNNQLYHGLLKTPDVTNHTPLHTALLRQNYAFVDAILRHKKLDKFEEILTEESNNENCLHLAIRGGYDDLELLIKKCAEHESLFSKKDKNWDTPLHAAVRKVYPAQMKEMLRKRKLIPETGASQPTEDQVGPEDEGGPGDEEESEDEDYQLKNVIFLVAQCREALWNQNPGERTPYQERLEELSKAMRRILPQDDVKPDSASINDAFREIVLEDRIAHYIRSYCIRELSRDLTMKCLYKPGQGRALFHNKHSKSSGRKANEVCRTSDRIRLGWSSELLHLHRLSRPTRQALALREHVEIRGTPEVIR
jgi:ankyrin repeat protein